VRIRDNVMVVAPALRALEIVRQLPLYEKAVLLLLLIAAWSPYSPPTAQAYVDPDVYTSIWSYRPVASLNIFELGIVFVGLLYAFRARREGIGRSFLDVHFVAFAALVIVLELVALARNADLLLFKKVDTERVALLFSTYAVLSRCRLGARQLKFFAFALAGVLLLRFATLVVQYGFVESTEFATATGRIALLITEDALLAGFAVALLWGLVVDDVVRGGRAVAVGAVGILILLVDVLSLRRGALIFLGAILVVRSVRASRALVLTTVAVLAATAIGALAFSRGSVYRDVKYVGRSTALQTHDASTGQRTAEWRNFRKNTHGAGELLLGHGLGAAWQVVVPIPTDIASFGSKETKFVRVGWHVYGLDWLYKLGIVGLCASIGILAHAALSIGRVFRRVRDRVLRSFVSSLGLVGVVMLLFLFTNARLAVFAGICVGLISKIADGAERLPVPAETT
jgi:hypothetical protein